MTDPAKIASEAVDKMIEKGALKHAGESWRTEPKVMHYLKAARHFQTAAMIELGYYPPDGENHAENGICRGAMGLAIE